MTLELLPTPVETSAGNSDLFHWWCCDPLKAVCGTKLEDAPDEEDEPPLDEQCVVCNDLLDNPTYECPDCGDLIYYVD